MLQYINLFLKRVEKLPRLEIIFSSWTESLKVREAYMNSNKMFQTVGFLRKFTFTILNWARIAADTHMFTHVNSLSVKPRESFIALGASEITF